MSNKTNSLLYIGVTNNLVRRVEEHRKHIVKGFTDKYNASKLVYYEVTSSAYSAILREKQLKKWSRQKKEWLIDKVNPERDDLFYQIVNLRSLDFTSFRSR
jgi:putative endonuclease